MLKALDKIIHFFMRSELTVVLWIATIVVVFCVLVMGAEARADDTQFYNHVRQGQCADEADLMTRAELLLFPQSSARSSTCVSVQIYPTYPFALWSMRGMMKPLVNT